MSFVIVLWVYFFTKLNRVQFIHQSLVQNHFMVKKNFRKENVSFCR